MSKSSPRRYDAEFKANILRLHAQGRSVADLEEAFGVHHTVIYRWKKKAAKTTASPPSAQAEQVADLQRRLAQVTEERDILKKALAIFSRHPLK